MDAPAVDPVDPDAPLAALPLDDPAPDAELPLDDAPAPAPEPLNLAFFSTKLPPLEDDEDDADDELLLLDPDESPRCRHPVALIDPGLWVVDIGRDGCDVLGCDVLGWDELG